MAGEMFGIFSFTRQHVVLVLNATFHVKRSSTWKPDPVFKPLVEVDPPSGPGFVQKRLNLSECGLNDCPWRFESTLTTDYRAFTLFLRVILPPYRKHPPVLSPYSFQQKDFHLAPRPFYKERVHWKAVSIGRMSHCFPVSALSDCVTGIQAISWVFFCFFSGVSSP